MMNFKDGVVDNKVVAITMSLCLSPENDKEFKKEIILFGGVRHANLLELLGGYVALEHCYGTLNEMYDVYSFGILTLKILTGTKRLTHRGDLEFVDYVEKMLKEGTFLNTMNEEHWLVYDPDNKVQRCFQIALACASFYKESMPTMKLVLSMLDGAPLELPNPPVLTSISFGGSSAGLTSGSSLTTQYFSTTACRSMELVS